MSAWLPVKGVLHVLADDLAEGGPDYFEDVVMRYELGALEDLLGAHARFDAYLQERDECR